MKDLDIPAWLDEAPAPTAPPEGAWAGEADVIDLDAYRASAETERMLPFIKPSAFKWRNPATIAPREWLYGQHLIRQYVSATIAPGGVGKSTLAIGDAVAMATGKPLLSVKPHGPLLVWVWNGEDPREEIERRVSAAMLRYGIVPNEIEGRLWIDSGRDTAIKISDDSQKIAMPIIDALTAAIRERGIDVLIVDPFVSVHSLPENDNGAMDAAVKAFALVADRTGCAIDLVHHSRKLNGADADIDSARGGSAIAGAVRAARALNVMSTEAAKAFGIDERERRSYVRIDNAKANLAPPSGARWVKLTPEPLGNATPERPEDIVAVAEPWTPPDMLEGITLQSLIAVQMAIKNKALRENTQARNWVGYEIGKVLGLNPHTNPDKQKIKNAVKRWLASGALVVETIYDARNGRDAKVINVGEMASAAP